jgi:hypothetical protein
MHSSSTSSKATKQNETEARQQVEYQWMRKKQLQMH